MSILLIDVVGYSGSGKTEFITNAIKLLQNELNYKVSVIKNVKGHPVDEKGKDSYRFTEAGALYSVIQNSDKEMAIFMKCKEDRFEELLKWLNASPIKSDIMFTEGFRNLNNPTVLCISEIDEIGDQLTENVKMISGVICSKTRPKNEINNIPIVDIKVQFQEFLKLFNIFPKRS